MQKEVLKGVLIAVITAAVLAFGSLLSGDQLVRWLGGVTQKDGKLYIGEDCYTQRELVRCAIRGRSDHMTWVDNAAECAGAGVGGVNEGAVKFLAACK